MKGGLCVIYTSLLTISVLSSCALFMLVVSEGHLGVDEGSVDLSGLHNVSQKRGAVSDEDQAPDSVPSRPPDEPVENLEMIYADSLSLNSVTTDGLPDTGQPPILISLADNAKLDLKTPEELLFANDSEQHNETKTFTIIDGSEVLEEKEKEVQKDVAESHLVVKAKPMHEVRQTEDAFHTTPPPEEPAESQPEDEEKTNIPVKPEMPQEDIPSFSEWAQKQLAEAEKKDTVLNHSSQPSHSSTNFSSKSTKVRSKNYASPSCAAKVVACNPEAGSASSILSPNRDEYMLNTCNSRIWFVVELCEAVQAQKIEIANFELFSSTPKEFAVYFSDRFPTREWASVGQFTAKDLRDVQSFDLFPHLFGKFIKVELLSHHGSEHYCPISLFKVYGTSEFEVLEKESSQHAAHIDDDDDDETIDVPAVPVAETEPTKNLFGSARDAVMSIMKKAAQALVKTEVPKNVSSEHNDTSTDKMYKRCCSPSHIIVCDNCSESLYNEVYELVSCSSDKLTNLVRQVFLRETLKCTGICQPFGLDFKSTKTIEFAEERVAYMNALFPPKYLAALCNILAIKEKKVVLNTSFETELNVTSNLTVDESPQNISSETNSEQDVKLVSLNNTSSDQANETVKSEDKPVIVEETVEKPVPVEIPKEEERVNEPVVKEDKFVLEKPELLDSKTSENVEIKTDQKEPAKDGKKEVTTEKPKEVFVLPEDGGDQMIMDGDPLSDLDQIAVDPTPGPASQNQPQSTIQKESVFLRLSNRVKTLERNMSLSGQYLEELSRRYKKQVEEMQRSFEKTMLQMSEERRKSNEIEQKYLEQMTNLQDQIAQMTAAMKVLMEERDSWFGNMTVFKFLVFQAVVVAAVLYYFNRTRPEPLIVHVPRKVNKKKDKIRRKSVEGVSGHQTPSAKKRRPSEEALQITRQAVEEANDVDDEGEWQIARKNRRRKTSILHRNLEDPKAQYCRQDSMGMLQENPIPLDEEEFTAPVPEPVKFNEVANPRHKVNGSIFNNLKKTSKRRLSSPAFLKSLSRQSTRSTPSPVLRKEPIFNGLGKASVSESPTGSLWSESTEMSQNGQNEGGTKKKKSLKNIIKKLF